MLGAFDLSSWLDHILDKAADNLRIAKIFQQMGLDPNNITYEVLFDRLGLAGLWESRPRVAEWFTRIKTRPSFKGISDYPPIDYDDNGRDGLQNWTRIKELIAA